MEVDVRILKNIWGVPIIDVSLGVAGMARVADGVAEATPPATPATPTRIWATPCKKQATPCKDQATPCPPQEKPPPTPHPRGHPCDCCLQKHL